MITLARLNELYREELAKVVACGVPVSMNEMPKEITTMKATSKYGDCHWEWGRNKSKIKIRIRISEYHLPNGEDAVRQTIAHEICHAAPGRGHGDEWKKWANMVNKAYGYHIERLGTWKSGCTLERPEAADKAVSRGHLVVCTKCGAQYPRTRHSRLTLHPEYYHCHCGGKLKLEY